MTNSKSVYLASRYRRRKELENYAQDLANQGWEVTSRWVFGHHENDCRSPTIYALEDWDDLARAQWMMAFTEEPNDHGSYSRGGRHVELGMALAWGKNVVIVGPRENVFCHLPQVRQADTFEAAVSMMTAP